jgi:hypothetical protein
VSEIRAEIEETRAEMGETIEAIQERLRPGSVVSRAASTMRDAAIGKVKDMTSRSWEDRTPRRAADWYYGDGLLDRIREHPVPAAIAAASLTWLAFAGRPKRDYEGPPYNGSWSERYGSNLQASEPDRSTNTYEHESYDAGPLADRGRHTAADALHRVRDAGQGTRQGMRRMARENTLTAGLIAAGIGVAIGFVLPETERENELLGEARDSMLDRATTAAKGAAKQVQETATKAAGEALTGMGGQRDSAGAAQTAPRG